jgi:ribulose-phosphate 3-epimerase
VISTARDLGLKVGLAVNPETPVSKIKSLTDKVDSVLFLSVHPGFYGAKFIPETLDKIMELRQARPNLVISIDGGIKKIISYRCKSGVMKSAWAAPSFTAGLRRSFTINW